MLAQVRMCREVRFHAGLGAIWCLGCMGRGGESVPEWSPEYLADGIHELHSTGSQEVQFAATVCSRPGNAAVTSGR